MKVLKPIVSIMALAACTSSFAMKEDQKLIGSLKKHQYTRSMEDDLSFLDTDKDFSNLKMRGDADIAINYINAKDSKKIRNLLFSIFEWQVEEATESKITNKKLDKIEALLKQIVEKH